MMKSSRHQSGWLALPLQLCSLWHTQPLSGTSFTPSLPQWILHGLTSQHPWVPNAAWVLAIQLCVFASQGLLYRSLPLPYIPWLWWLSETVVQVCIISPFLEKLVPFGWHCEVLLPFLNIPGPIQNTAALAFMCCRSWGNSFFCSCLWVRTASETFSVLSN